MNQIDMRMAKILAFSRARTAISVDLINLMNVNPVGSYNANFASWLQPQRILQARFAKLGVQVDS